MSPTLDGSRFPPSIFNSQKHLKTRLRVRDIIPDEKEIIQYDSIELHFIYEGEQDTPNMWLRKKVNIPIIDKSGISEQILFPFAGEVYVYNIYFIGTSFLNPNQTRLKGFILYDENVSLISDDIIETRYLEIVSPSDEFLKNVLKYPYWELLSYTNRISLEKSTLLFHYKPSVNYLNFL